VHRSRLRRRLKSSASAAAASRFAGIAEEGENRDALTEVDVLCFVDEASVPAEGGTLVPRVLFISEQEREPCASTGRRR
jgi:hypothetical protein